MITFLPDDRLDLVSARLTRLQACHGGPPRSTA